MKIYIHPIPGSLLNEIFLVQEDSHRNVITTLNFKEDGLAIASNEIIQYGAASNAKPTMILPEQETRDLIEAFISLGKDRKITPSEDSTKGKLEATERHLEDMRTLVFKKK